MIRILRYLGVLPRRSGGGKQSFSIANTLLEGLLDDTNKQEDGMHPFDLGRIVEFCCKHPFSFPAEAGNWLARRDLNPRHLPNQGSVLIPLNYRPINLSFRPTDAEAPGPCCGGLTRTLRPGRVGGGEPPIWLQGWGLERNWKGGCSSPTPSTLCGLRLSWPEWMGAIPAILVETRRIELPTSSLRTKRSPN